MVLGEEDIYHHFRNELGHMFPPFISCSTLHLDVYERRLQGEKKHTRRELFLELKHHGRVHVPSFAKVHTRSDRHKVWRAKDALLRDIPALAEHVRGELGEEYIALVDKKPSL